MRRGRTFGWMNDGLTLITGATGFLGRFLVAEFLAAGHAVRVLARRADHPSMDTFGGRVEVAVGDVTRPETLEEALRGVRFVVHAAGHVAFAKKEKDRLLAVNREGTAHVVNYALEAGAEKLVYVSSVAALGRPAALEEPITEDLPWQESPYNTQYAYSKYLGEREVIRGVAEGLPAVIANPTLIIGPGPWQTGTGQFFRKVDRGLRYYPTGSNGFTGVWDVARATRLLLASDYRAGERFIVCGDNLPHQAFLRMVAEALGKQPPSQPLPLGLAIVLGRLFEAWSALTGATPLLTAETARTSAHHTRYENTRLRSALGFAYEPLLEVVRKTGAAYLQGRNL